ncbi:hypothetical protein Barb4_02896 [Bacteroidales bacterium Barb4]|nr:hypothetical protein Barb4_02896 [Bacteroidales bacterium Barb4]
MIFLTRITQAQPAPSRTWPPGSVRSQPPMPWPPRSHRPSSPRNTSSASPIEEVHLGLPSIVTSSDYPSAHPCPRSNGSRTHQNTKNPFLIAVLQMIEIRHHPSQAITVRQRQHILNRPFRHR